MKKDPQKSFALLGDVPVGEYGRVDKLGFSATAEVLAISTLETRDPLTIGIFGRWGVGKTSLMRLIKQKVEEIDENGAFAVWFNAWQYEKEEHLIVPLIATINKELGKRKGLGENLVNAINKIKEYLTDIACGISIKGEIGFPFVTKGEVTISPKDMREGKKETNKDTLLSRSLYFEAFERLSELAEKSEVPRIVVFIDDLDRCLPNNAMELLEHIKLVLSQRGFAFVLGVNDEIISALVRKKFTKDYELDPSCSEDYLDKIVQVKIHVPRRKAKEMDKYISNLLDAGKVFPESSPKDIIPSIAEAGRRNPRSIVRLLNRIIVISRIGKLEGKDYDPLALLLHEAMDEPRYEDFCKALEIPVLMENNENPIIIGKYLADQLGKFEGDLGVWIAELREIKMPSRKDEFLKAVETLHKNDHLVNLLNSPVGKRWLSDKQFREMIVEASERTITERKSEEEKKEEIPSKQKDVIQELLNNMVPIPKGSFMRGSDESESEKPVREVTIKAFQISAMPIKQSQYEEIMKDNPSNFKGNDLPVESVTWNDATEFCKELSKRTGKIFTLPTEAQWEYACRAGSDAEYCFGDSEKELGDYAWYSENSGGKTHPVGTKKPNNWGLYDMHGNVWEWCLDHWQPNYENAYDDGRAWISGDDGAPRVVRGGSWGSDAGYCRSAFRFYGSPDLRWSGLGFRVCLQAGK
jgi:formylglycine-generating enzyme required for sulfatase activity/Cdc6-like AAA superfamily ATPase